MRKKPEFDQWTFSCVKYKWHLFLWTKACVWVYTFVRLYSFFFLSLFQLFFVLAFDVLNLLLDLGSLIRAILLLKLLIVANSQIIILLTFIQYYTPYTYVFCTIFTKIVITSVVVHSNSCCLHLWLLFEPVWCDSPHFHIQAEVFLYHNDACITQLSRWCTVKWMLKTAYIFRRWAKEKNAKREESREIQKRTRENKWKR